jgi:hypothetical protein
MCKSPVEENYDNQKHLIFEKNKAHHFLKNLNNELNLQPNKNILNTSITILQLSLLSSTSSQSRFCIKKENRMTNPWYDKECEIVRKTIRDVSKNSLKYDKINSLYKFFIKGKKMYY